MIKIDFILIIPYSFQMETLPQHIALLVLDSFLQTSGDAALPSMFAAVIVSHPDLHAQMVQVMDPELEEDSTFKTMGLKQLKEFAFKMRVDMRKQNKQQIVERVAAVRKRDEFSGLTPFVLNQIASGQALYKLNVGKLDIFNKMKLSLMSLVPDVPELEIDEQLCIVERRKFTRLLLDGIH